MVCAMVSVQPFTCPVSDTEDTIRKEGIFQTMLNIGSFTIERSKFKHGVFIVFLVLKVEIFKLEIWSVCQEGLKPWTFTSTVYHAYQPDESHEHRTPNSCPKGEGKVK